MAPVSMGIVDFILNLAGLLLWVNWVLMSASPKTGRPTTLLGTLRPADPSTWRRWSFLASLPALLTVRAWLYWEVGSTAAWAPALNFGVIGVTFRCDLFQRAFVYSALSFMATLGVFYLWLLLLSILNRKPPSPDPLGRFVQTMLGPLARLRSAWWIFLPLVVGTLLWLPLNGLLVWMKLVPEPESFLHLIEQGGLVGLGVCLTWSHLLAGVLLLYLVNSYVHLGEHPLWPYVNSVAGTFLTAFRRLPLQFGRVDFAPVVALAVVYLTARGGERLLLTIYRKLPL